MRTSPRKLKTSAKGKKRAANNVPEDVATSNIPRVKRSRRLSSKARRGLHGSSEDSVPGRTCDADENATHQTRGRSEHREVDKGDGQSTVDKRADDNLPAASIEVRPTGSEPSTATRDMFGPQVTAQATTDETRFTVDGGPNPT